MLSLSQYENDLLEAGYDDIDFVSDITVDELCDIGITKKGLSVVSLVQLEPLIGYSLLLFVMMQQSVRLIFKPLLCYQTSYMCSCYSIISTISGVAL